MMEISEGFWLSLKYPNIECKCQYCYEGRILNDIERYNSELEARIKYRTLDKTFFCPFRTFHVQESILTIPTSEIQLGIDRLFRVKCEKGYLEYRLLDNPPLDESPSKEVIFNISYGLLPMKYEKHIKKQDRVGQIKYSFSK